MSSLIKMINQSFLFCHYCGTSYDDSKAWPRQCNTCNNFVWQNPKPVVVALTAVNNGLLLVKRNIQPGYGEWALPGGFMDMNESWQEACARELLEETGVEVDANKIDLSGVYCDGSHILFFGHTEVVSIKQIKDFIPNNEVSEIMIGREPMKLAFDSHTEYMRKAFGNKH
jgi:8-oxo-dGTP diphosphatase